MTVIPSVFLIESPLQLFNAIEAKNFFKLKKCKLIVVYSQNVYNNLQIDQLLNFYLEWDSVHKITPASRKRFKVLTVKKIINELSLIAKEKFHYVFIGDYRPEFMLHFCNISKYNKLVILDDGTATIDIMKDYLCLKKKNKIKPLLKSILLGFNLKDKKDLFFFSIYKNSLLENQIIKNNYTYFKSVIDGFKFNKNSVIFLGSKIVELNVISQEKYLMYLSNLKNKFGEKKITYIPHRHESDTKLKVINQTLNINIVRSDSIIEFYLVNNKELPYAVTGFFCSALLNLKILFNGKLRITSFYIQNKDFDDQFAKRFEDMYQYYRNNNIEVVEKY